MLYKVYSKTPYGVLIKLKPSISDPTISVLSLCTAQVHDMVSAQVKAWSDDEAEHKWHSRDSKDDQVTTRNL